MNSLVDKAVRESKTGIFTYSDVLTWFSGTRPAIRAMVTRAVASGDVLRIRRGLYCLVRDLAPFLPSEYVLANLAYGPSYVSMESALEYHGWIPEAVRTVVCVTSSRAKKFLTPFGRTGQAVPADEGSRTLRRASVRDLFHGLAAEGALRSRRDSAT